MTGHLGVIHLRRPQENQGFDPAPPAHMRLTLCGRAHAADMKYTFSLVQLIQVQ